MASGVDPLNTVDGGFSADGLPGDRVRHIVTGSNQRTISEGFTLRFDAGGTGPVQPELSVVTGSDGQNSRRHASLNILVYILDTFDNVLFH